jgi:hypothetical protein
MPRDGIWIRSGADKPLRSAANSAANAAQRLPSGYALENSV